jgi:AraC family ethanolamine operon transcriptional activator
VTTSTPIPAKRPPSKPSAASPASARALRTAFQEVTGLSPLHFIKTRLLNAARHALAAGNPEEVSVKIVARAHGFWHLGRFAHDYLTLFGESPSMTLGRR